jgi:hypothetical protein
MSHSLERQRDSILPASDPVLSDQDRFADRLKAKVQYCAWTTRNPEVDLSQADLDEVALAFGFAAQTLSVR